MVESYGVAAFRSRQQVLRFEQQLRQEGIGNIRVVSTPREVAVGCGLSIQFSLADAPAVVSAIRRAQPANLVGVYRVERVGSGKPRLSALSL